MMLLQNSKNGPTKQLRDAGKRKLTQEAKMGTGIKPSNNMHSTTLQMRPMRDCNSTLFHLRIMWTVSLYEHLLEYPAHTVRKSLLQFCFRKEGARTSNVKVFPS